MCLALGKTLGLIYAASGDHKEAFGVAGVFQQRREKRYL